VVIGATGSGKSTLAERLAARLGGAYVELDALHWEPHWTEAAPDVFRERVERATAGARWVVAGNYGRVRDLVWPRADTGLAVRPARARASANRAPAPAARGGSVAREHRSGLT
jgi:adenylate kinase family enzyme